MSQKRISHFGVLPYVKPILSFEVIAGKIDKEKGLISGVSVITMGEARGHEMMIDNETLQQVKACAEAFKTGLKVALDHYSGIEAVVGYLKNFKIEGSKLLADLQLLETHPKREYVLELAETIPDNFGISISFSGDHDRKDGVTYARCNEIYSADLVRDPAANKGLFQKPTQTVDTSPNNNMDPKQFSEAIANALKPISDRLESLEKKPTAEEIKAQKDAALKEQTDLMAKVMAEQFAKLNINPVNPAGAAAVVTTPEKKSFWAIVEEFEAKGMKRTDAQLAALKTKQGKEAYQAYREQDLGFQTKKGSGPGVQTILN